MQAAAEVNDSRAVDGAMPGSETGRAHSEWELERGNRYHTCVTCSALHRAASRVGSL